MKKAFALVALPLIALTLPSCSPEASTGMEVDRRGSFEAGADTVLEAMVRRNGLDLVNELKSGYGGLVYFAQDSCPSCEAIDEIISKAVAATGFYVNLVYIEHGDQSDYRPVKDYFEETFGNPNYGRFTPSLYYAEGDECREIFVGGGNYDEKAFERLFASNFEYSHVTRFDAERGEPGNCSLLFDLSDGEMLDYFASYVRPAAIKKERDVALLDYACLKSDDPDAFLSWLGLSHFENAVLLEGAAYPFMDGGREALEGYLGLFPDEGVEG